MRMGVLEKIYKDFEWASINNHGLLSLHDIINFVKELQKNEYDAHVLIVGQNGTGKSYLMLQLLYLFDKDFYKKQKEDGICRILFAYHDTRDLIKTISNLKNSAIGIDEAKKFFHYKMSMTTEQNLLVNYIEYARSNRIAFFVCAKDYAHINNNYRQGKVQMVIWLIDKYKNERFSTIGGVFLGNPVIDSEDRFDFWMMRYAKDFEGFRILAENTSSFRGYLLVPNAYETLPQEVINFYKEEKEKGIKAMMEKSLQKLEEKEKTKEQKKKNIEDGTNLMAGIEKMKETEKDLFDYIKKIELERGGKSV